ncbi:MAG: glycosyltransferase N-terminal domain-containing protein [Bacteroidales bacterium]|nr:glycosyltransferase N-terminal domain-containing protein [Bacteroidales bacterium]
MFYNIAIYAYLLAVRVAALFWGKPRRMVRGHKKVFNRLKDNIDPTDRYIWFHASSLGEFEQGRPLMETIKKDYPAYKILLTFFSPSGYEVQEHYEYADLVTYLPFDTPRNARRFMQLVHPTMAFFIKYEFWKNYLTALHDSGIPTYSVSSIFRPKQIFFRRYARKYSEVLLTFTTLFVQNEESKTLLAGIGVKNVEVTGDTRFDRVLEIRNQAKDLPRVELFKGNNPMFIVGSSWPSDEEIYIPYFNELLRQAQDKNHKAYKLIIAPHVVEESRLQEIESRLQLKSVRYTRASDTELADAQCLIVDCYKMLSSIYRYADFAYIGGGFISSGIHNVLEAAVYGVGTVFGTVNKKFLEAQQLMELKGSYEFKDYKSFARIMDEMLASPEKMAETGAIAKQYVYGNAGTTAKILASLQPMLSQ